MKFVLNAMEEYDESAGHDRGGRLVQGLKKATASPWTKDGTTPPSPFSHSPQLQLA